MGDRVVSAKSGLVRGALLLPLPAVAGGDPGLPAGASLALFLALLVLLLAWLALASHRRREREQRAHQREQEERAQQWRLSLWASNEVFWQYDLRSRELEVTRVTPDGDHRLAMHASIERSPKFHDDDRKGVLRQLRDYLRGEAPVFGWGHPGVGGGGRGEMVGGGGPPGGPPPRGGAARPPPPPASAGGRRPRGGGGAPEPALRRTPCTGSISTVAR